MIEMFIVPLSQIETLFPVQQTGGVAQQTAVAGVPFADILKNAMQNVQQTQEVSRQDNYKLALGLTDDLHTMEINSLKADAAIQYTVGLASRALTAYNEIIRMQI